MRHALSVCMLVVLAAAPLAACKGSESNSNLKKGKGVNKMAYPVTVAPLAVRQVKYNVTAPGSLDAFQQVQITARVAGAVDKVNFAEGENVLANQVLATIESDRYEIAVEQAKTELAKSIANEKSAEAALERRVEAQKSSPGLVPGEEIEQKQTAVDTAKADVDAAKQGLRVAQLNLRDSAVKTPIPGTVQTRTVQQGEFLQPGAVLATILQRDPMLLRFQVTEADAPRLKVGMVANLLLRESTRTFTSKITLVGGAADPSTRLVSVTAQIDKTDHPYWLRPGAFCEVTVPIGDARQGIVVPSLAVTPTEKGNVVYIVDAKNIAHAKVVELGMHTPEGGVELTRGVAAGDLLVVNGVQPLSDGAPVKINTRTTLDAVQVPGDAGVGPTTPPVSPLGSAAGSAAPQPKAPQ